MRQHRRVLAFLLIGCGLAALPPPRRSPRPPPRGQAGRPPGGAPRGPAAGLLDPRVRRPTRYLAGDALLRQPGRLRPDQAARDAPRRSSAELAEKWSWQDNYRNLVFFLRGRQVARRRPFTSKDVKFTFDTVREAAGRPARNSGSTRERSGTRTWTRSRPPILHGGVPPEAAAALPGGHARLRLLPGDPRPRAVRQHRSRCIGTGPFKFKEWKRGQSVELVRNPDYFVKGRPYLDGVRYTVIVERGTRVAALQAGQIDVAYPGGDHASRSPSSSRARSRHGVHARPRATSARTCSSTPRSRPSTTSRCGARSASPSTGAPTSRPCIAGRGRRRLPGAQAVGRVGPPREGPRPAPGLRRGRGRDRRRPGSSWPRRASGRRTRSRSRWSRARSRSTSTSRPSWSASSSRSGWRRR